MKKEGLFMLKKAVLLAVSLVLFTVFNAILIIAPSNDPACCTNPEVPSFCLDEAFPGTPNLYADINDCCFGDQDCADQYLKLGTSCNTLSECTTGIVVGCCIDECKSGTQAQCKNKAIDNFKAVSCDNIASCSTGCCLCTDAQAPDGTPGEQKLAFNLITEPECKSDCQDRGYASYLFNPQQDDCRIGVKLQGVKVSGLVTDISGKPLEKATVIIQGIGQLETLSGGEYEIEDVPPGKYVIKVIKSQYLTNVTTFTIAAGETEKIINFNLMQAAFGTISGKVTDDSPSLKEIPNAVIKVTGLDTDNDYLSDQQGNYALLFHLLAQEKDYNIEASAPGYFSKTETATLSAGNNNVALDFHLTKKQKGRLKVLVLNSIDQITPIQGARVTLGTGLQRFTDLIGEVIFGGLDRPSDNIYEGNYSVTIFKPLFLTNATLFEVKPYIENVLAVYLEQDNDMCYLAADSGRGIFEEYIRTESCSQLNKPYYCRKGDLRGKINDLEYNNCQGKDGTARTADDCCPANQECQDNGFCLPKDVQCTSTCTFKNDLTCRAVCNGTAGCLFYNQQVKLDCDGKSAINTILSGSKYDLAADQSIVCCAGVPRSSKKEDCLTKEDDDEDGKINCADPDCYQKPCHPTDKSRICQPDRDGKLTEKGCRAKLCSSGEITSANAGCECVPFSGVTAQVGNYCCALDKTLYQGPNAKADFITTSPCGNTPCRLAKPIQGTCCRACKEASTPGSLLKLGENACNYQGIKCCVECSIISDFTCAYRSQCPDYALLTGDRTQQTQQTNVLCPVACEDIKSCAENTPIFDMNLNKPLCKCNENTYLVPSLEASGKYCCKADNKLYVSNSECPAAPELGKITGTVTDSVTGNPILGASICTNPTTCYGVTNNDGKYEIRIRFDTEYTFYAIKPGYIDSAKLDPITVNEFQIRSKLKVMKEPDASRIKENQDFKLTEEKDVCTQDLPPVKFFTVNHTPGDVKKIQLKWGKPDCPRIMGFEIIKTLVPAQPTTTTVISAQATATQPIPLLFMEPNKDSFVDSEVDYDKTYEYEIKVKYLPTGLKSQANTSRITVGQLQCEGMYRNNQHVQFCAVNSANKLVDKKRCNKENRVKKDNKGAEEVIGSCDPNTQVCSGPNAAGLA
ncbi:carboxypeptidase regulatory-like domain-containing protein, partial [Candidatus Woesearchaeota archaeon]|nr:carboxypeptidase regulatory-like domain-containing protein [Candidatus Woesearchaeota archaeon]